MSNKRILAFLVACCISLLPACKEAAATPSPADTESAAHSSTEEAGATRQADIQPDTESGETPETATAVEGETPVSPLPDMDAFIEGYNAAADELGAIRIDPDRTRPLSWNSGTIAGGFSYDMDTGAILFDPYYVRIVAREEDMSNVILVYAACTAAVTGLPAQECLGAMNDLVENAQEDTWENGYEVNLNNVLLEGLLFEYEYGRSTRISQMFINAQGNGLSEVIPGDEE